MAYMLPIYHFGVTELAICASSPPGMIVKKDPCSKSTRRRGGSTASPANADAVGGYTVIEVRKIVWCCNAAHPSVARSAAHLHAYETATQDEPVADVPDVRKRDV